MPINHYCLLTTLICALCCTVWAAGDPLRYQPGVRNSPGPNAIPLKHLTTLLENLRQKTGFLEMGFDANGFLKLGDRARVSGGSAAARELLIAAVDRAVAIDLEYRNSSSEIAFARLNKPISYISRLTGVQIDVYPIEIDFNDFAHLRGDKLAVAAFDVGYVVLHELAHAALGLRDALVNGEGPGECEEYINCIRRELGVPERQSYIANTYFRKLSPSQKAMQQAELFFAQTTAQPGKTKTQTLNLVWEAERVGGIKQPDYKQQTILPKSQSSPAP